MKLAIMSMELDDIPQVVEVDRESYTVPWPASAYRREILHNRNARYVVLREISSPGRSPAPEPPPRAWMPFPFLRRSSKNAGDASGEGRIVGYAGMWIMIDEAHITTIAVRHDWRRHGFGELLLASLIESASELAAHRMTLEVRVSNEAAQSLYRKYGFRQEGIRPRYYSDDNEDAYIMTTGDIQDEEYRRQFDRLVKSLSERLTESSDELVASPPFVFRENIVSGAKDQPC